MAAKKKAPVKAAKARETTRGKTEVSATPKAGNSKNAVAHVNHSVWVAPSEKSDGSADFEKRLWEAADQFRANSGLKAQEYSGPILGLIFLRFAEVRFVIQNKKLEQAATSARRGSTRVSGRNVPSLAWPCGITR